ncbi:stromelysin-3-like isoform X2 [Adelges cooleyi]|nr:stromelysin-3-like isoform X2 [Adelges cooleyi]
MNAQRCGCHDKFYRAKEGRPKRFVRLLDGWRTNNLKYKISRYPTKELNKSQTDAEIKRAFDQWSEVTPLQFIQTSSGPVQINIAFQANYHGDISPFDGVLGVFAHTLTPNRSNVHFDDSETWTTGTKRGTNLYQVALHEFGHMLGLDHTKVKFAVMRPVYPGYNPNYKLKNDDIEGIQELYGENNFLRRNDKVRTKRQTNSEINYTEEPDLCENSKLDTVFRSSEGHTFVLKGDYHWKLINKSTELGYPKLITEQWIGLPGHIDAAFTHNNGQTYFFKGSNYWKFTGTTPGKRYPRDIASGFAGIPNNINAAMVWRDNKILFFKGAKYWMYDLTKNLTAHSKSTSDWKGIPESIDAALRTTQNLTYVFKDNYYYTFNDNSSLIDTFSAPTVRRKIETIWFNCKPKTTTF